jgi:predicted alpha/beta hydrolase family esterase
MPTIIYIHGGNIRETPEQYQDYLSTTDMRYKAYPQPTRPDRLKDQFPDANIIAPRMPRKQRAQYDEWKLWIDRCLEFITPDEPVIWIGRSLGALFLAKYASLSTDLRIDQLHLIAGIYYPSSKEKFTDNRFPCGFDLTP